MFCLLLLFVTIFCQPATLPTPVLNRDCSWRRRKTQNRDNLLSRFFPARQGLCLHTCTSTSKGQQLLIIMFDPQQAVDRQLTLSVNLPLNHTGKIWLTMNRDVMVGFQDPESEQLFTNQIKFNRQAGSQRVSANLQAGGQQLSLYFERAVGFELAFGRVDYMEEELMIICVCFIILNYQWFYFSKHGGLILKEFKAVKKGWCFKLVALFWTKHTSLPMHFEREIYKFWQLFQNSDNLLQVSILTLLMGCILLFLGVEIFNMGGKMLWMKDRIKAREVADYMLTIGVFLMPMEETLMVMPLAKLVQVGYILSLQQSYFIKYYEEFGKLSLDWLQIVYYSLYPANLAGLPINYPVAAAAIAVFAIELLLFLMEILSNKQYLELSQQIQLILAKFSALYQRATPKREEVEACSICLESFSAEGAIQFVDFEEMGVLATTSIAITRCNHKFHASCLQKWLQQNTECPLDRQSLKKREEQSYELKE